jgi:hypothetical protein
LLPNISETQRYLRAILDSETRVEERRFFYETFYTAKEATV